MESIAYEYVITVARHLNISKAAQELCITQPALTKFINRLEKKMGAKLFDRTTTPIPSRLRERNLSRMPPNFRY